MFTSNIKGFSGISIEVKGRLVSEPEARYTPGGTLLCNARLAVQAGWVSKERSPTCPTGWKSDYKGKGWELTAFVKLTAWGERAEALNALKKGAMVHAVVNLGGQTSQGTLNANAWKDKTTGEARANHEFTVAYFLGESEAQASEDYSGEQEPPDMDEERAQIPF